MTLLAVKRERIENLVNSLRDSLAAKSVSGVEAAMVAGWLTYSLCLEAERGSTETANEIFIKLMRSITESSSELRPRLLKAQ